jgi:nucleotide-binding universal stress UspA family protein
MTNQYSVKKILVPLDGSANSFRGLEKAIYFAKQCNATVTGIYVKFRPSRFVYQQDEYIKSFLKDITKFMEKAETIAAKNEIVFEYEIMTGDVGEVIVNFAHNRKKQFDLIVIGSRGTGSATESFFGSVAHFVMNKSKIPVLVVK